LALFGILNLFDLSFLPMIGRGLLSHVGVETISIGFLIFFAGIFLVYRKQSVIDFEHYVPEYVSRLAERERFLQELEIARNIQMKFLPQSPPSFSQLEIASICKPAMEIGGDYFDFISEGSDHLSVVIGDVSGKGVSAAFYMTMAKGILKTLSKKIKHPKQLLNEANEIFYENAPRNVFVSVIYGHFDMQNKTLTFARAGHNPVIVRKRISAKPELFIPKGLAIGLEKGKLFSDIIEEETIAIEPHDIFVFYTDGVTEAMNKKEEEFGEERLREIIDANANLSAQDLLNTIVKEVKQFTGKAHQHDDFTMVVVKVS
jgi:serine phosphatase RsbU (regulator of sigma subunit)